MLSALINLARLMIEKISKVNSALQYIINNASVRESSAILKHHNFNNAIISHPTPGFKYSNHHLFMDYENHGVVP